MATSPITGGIRPVTPTSLNSGIVLSIAEARQIAEALVTMQEVAGRVGVHLIDRLDALDGDADLEATDAEDDFAEREQQPWHGPGCEIADGDCGVDDGFEDEDEREEDPGYYDSPGRIGGGGSGD